MAKTGKEVLDEFKSTADLTSHPGFESSISIASKDIKDDKPYNPFEHREVPHPNTFFGSMLHLLKGCLGSGLLAMPAAFKNSGLLAGSIGAILAGIVCTHAMQVFVKTSQNLCVDAKQPSLGFAETCGAAFTYGPKRVQKWGNAMKVLVDICMGLSYLGVLCIYVVFVGSSFKEVIEGYLPESQISIRVYCAFTFIPFVLICQIRNLKYLVPFSLIANFMIVVVFAITMYYMFGDLPPVSEREIVASYTTWPLFVSTVVFAMEGIGVVMPVENEMARPEKFLGCPGVLNNSMGIVILLYCVFGFFGYLKYGDDVKGSITLNLPQDSTIAQSAKLLMALVIFFTYALQFYVPMEIINRMLLNKDSIKFKNFAQISVRTTLVAVSVIVAIVFPSLELVISLVGAVFFSTLGLLFPAIINSVYLWDRGLGKFNYILWKNVVIGLISIIALLSGSYVSIVGLIEEFGGQGHKYDNTTLLL